MANTDFTSGSWFEKAVGDIVDTLGSDREKIEVDGDPPKMTRKAARSAFFISTGASIPGGAVGVATLVPELVALTKLQINLILKVAKFYQQETKVNKTIILAILGGALGVVLKHAFVNKVGTRIIVKSLSAEGTKRITRQIGEKIAVTFLKKGAGRLVPILLAPVFGYFSLSMTRKVGRQAESLFSHELEVD